MEMETQTAIMELLVAVCAESFALELSMSLFSSRQREASVLVPCVGAPMIMEALGLHYEYLDQPPSLVLWKTRGLCFGNVSSQSGLLIKYFQILQTRKKYREF
jgi:hypothetical protein